MAHEYARARRKRKQQSADAALTKGELIKQVFKNPLV